MDQSLIAGVQALLAETFQVPMELVPPELAFGGLPQWDSMGHMNLMLALEERYGIPIDADNIAQLTDIPAILARIEEQKHE